MYMEAKTFADLDWAVDENQIHGCTKEVLVCRSSSLRDAPGTASG